MRSHEAAFPASLAGTPLSRRLFLSGSVFGGASLLLPSRANAALLAGDDPPARAVIQIFLSGGLSHIDTFDPKPLAPVEYRGEFKTVASKLDGEPLSEVLSRTAAIADRLTIIRSFTHGEAAHERGTHNMVTGYRPSPVITYPSMGAVVGKQLGVRNKLPPYVCIPSGGLYSGTGYLSAAYAPFEPGGEPNSRSYRVRDLNSPSGVDDERLARRRKLVATVDAGFEGKGEADALDASQAFYEQAYALVQSEEARSAFDVNKEPRQAAQPLRPHDPRTTAAAGQATGAVRRALRHGQARRLRQPQSHLPGAATPHARLRPRLRGSHQRSREPGPTRLHTRVGDERVRSYATRQPHGRPRPLAARVLGRACRRRNPAWLRARCIQLDG